MRPEAIVPAEEGLPFTIRSIEQLGSQTLFIGELAGHRLRIMTGRRDGVVLGSDIKIAVPEAAIHLFDRESGERLTAG